MIWTDDYTNNPDYIYNISSDIQHTYVYLFSDILNLGVNLKKPLLQPFEKIKQNLGYLLR